MAGASIKSEAKENAELAGRLPASGFAGGPSSASRKQCFEAALAIVFAPYPECDGCKPEQARASIVADAAADQLLRNSHSHFAALRREAVADVARVQQHIHTRPGVSGNETARGFAPGLAVGESAVQWSNRFHVLEEICAWGLETPRAHRLGRITQITQPRKFLPKIMTGKDQGFRAALH